MTIGDAGAIAQQGKLVMIFFSTPPSVPATCWHVGLLFTMETLPALNTPQNCANLPNLQ
jgi:hypothetical protein